MRQTSRQTFEVLNASEIDDDGRTRLYCVTPLSHSLSGIVSTISHFSYQSSRAIPSANGKLKVSPHSDQIDQDL